MKKYYCDIAETYDELTEGLNEKAAQGWQLHSWQRVQDPSPNELSDGYYAYVMEKPVY